MTPPHPQSPAPLGRCYSPGQALKHLIETGDQTAVELAESLGTYQGAKIANSLQISNDELKDINRALTHYNESIKELGNAPGYAQGYATSDGRTGSKADVRMEELAHRMAALTGWAGITGALGGDARDMENTNRAQEMAEALGASVAGARAGALTRDVGAVHPNHADREAERTGVETRSAPEGSGEAARTDGDGTAGVTSRDTPHAGNAAKAVDGQPVHPEATTDTNQPTVAHPAEGVKVTDLTAAASRVDGAGTAGAEDRIGIQHEKLMLDEHYPGATPTHPANFQGVDAVSGGKWTASLFYDGRGVLHHVELHQGGLWIQLKSVQAPVVKAVVAEVKLAMAKFDWRLAQGPDWNPQGQNYPALKGRPPLHDSVVLNHPDELVIHIEVQGMTPDAKAEIQRAAEEEAARLSDGHNGRTLEGVPYRVEVHDPSPGVVWPDDPRLPSPPTSPTPPTHEMPSGSGYLDKQGVIHQANVMTSSGPAYRDEQLQVHPANASRGDPPSGGAPEHFSGETSGATNSGSGNANAGSNAGGATNSGSGNANAGSSAGGATNSGSGNANAGSSAGGATNSGSGNANAGSSAGDSSAGGATNSGSGNANAGSSAGGATNSGSGNANAGSSAGGATNSGSGNANAGSSAGGATNSGSGNANAGSSAGDSSAGGATNSGSGNANAGSSAGGATNSGSGNANAGSSAGGDAPGQSHSGGEDTKTTSTAGETVPTEGTTANTATDTPAPIVAPTPTAAPIAPTPSLALASALPASLVDSVLGSTASQGGAMTPHPQDQAALAHYDSGRHPTDIPHDGVPPTPTPVGEQAESPGVPQLAKLGDDGSTKVPFLSDVSHNKSPGLLPTDPQQQGQPSTALSYWSGTQPQGGNSDNGANIHIDHHGHALQEMTHAAGGQSQQPAAASTPNDQNQHTNVAYMNQQGQPTDHQGQTAATTQTNGLMSGSSTNTAQHDSANAALAAAAAAIAHESANMSEHS